MWSWWTTGSTLVLLIAPCAFTQTFQYLPEIDVYKRLNPNVRFVFQAKETREDGGPTQSEIGPSIEFYWRGLKTLVPDGVNAANTDLLLLSLGYRYLPSPNEPTTHRILLMATPRIPLRNSKVVLSDRNRGEVNFTNGDVTWRYRNRLQLERQFTIRSHHATPFANVEAYYDSNFQKWSSTVIRAGCQLPIRNHVEIDLYYEHQNNTGVAPNRQINAVGSILNLHF